MCILVDAGGRRSQSHQQAGARCIAARRIAVSVGEQHAAFGQFVHVRCCRLRVTAKGTHPVVQIINRYEQDVAA